MAGSAGIQGSYSSTPIAVCPVYGLTMLRTTLGEAKGRADDDRPPLDGAAAPPAGSTATTQYTPKV